MPPRRNKSTPKAVAPPSPPPAPTRRQTRTKAAAAAKKPSPKTVTKKPVDSDEVFASKSGGRGSLKYDGTDEEVINVSDDGEEEVTPTPGPSKQKKKMVPVKAKKVAGSRRVPPPPVKRKPNTVSTRSRTRRAPPAKESDSDVEVVEDGTLIKDEGYESAANSDLDPEDRAVKEEEQEGDDEEEQEQEEEEEEQEEDMSVDGDGSSDDDVDEDGNLKGLIDDEAEDEDGEDEDEMEVDEDEEPGEEEGEKGDGEPEQADDEVDNQSSSSPLPDKISKPLKNKRTAVTLSDAEDMPATRKQRTSVANDAPKTIKAIGHTSKVNLTMRDKKKQPAPKVEKDLEPKKSAPKKSAKSAPKESAQAHVPPQIAEVRTVQRKRKLVHVEIDASQTDNGKKKNAVVKDKNAVKEALTGKGKGKQQVETEEPKEQQPDAVEPQDCGCDVTHPDKQSMLLLGSYKGLPPLAHHKFNFTNEPQTAALDIVNDKEQFDVAYDPACIVDVLTVREITGPCIFNAARCAKMRLVEKPIGSGTAICPKSAPAGEVADIVIFGFVLSSTIVDGRQYQTPQSQNRVLKEIEVLPLQQEFERLTAMLGACTNGKIATIPITEQGALTFSTKHTTVDEDGNPDKKKAGLGGKFLAKAPRVTPHHIVHPDIVRRAREGTDTVPVFNSTANFMVNPEAGRTEQRLKAEEVLTQRIRPDPFYNAEIPQGSLVAVHSTVSLYTSVRGPKTKFMSFNLLAVQIIALPKDA